MQKRFSALGSSPTALVAINVFLWVVLLVVLFANGSFGGTPVLVRLNGSSNATAQPSSVADLQIQNQKLQDQLQAYQSLQQDMMAEQVYEKTWGKLIALL